jgi:hypothetical protein
MIGNVFSVLQRIPRLGFSSLVLLVAVAIVGARAGEPEIEVEAQSSSRVPTADLLSASLIKNKAYTLSPETLIYRGVALYEMESEFGRSTLVGDRGLMERIDELSAIEQLRAMKRSKVFGDALKKSGKAPVETFKNLADEPVDTMKNIGRGLGGFLSDVGYSIVSDDPNQENAAKTATGFAAAKRQFAYALGVSPYSSFQPLQDELSEVAWTAVGGGLTVSLGFSEIGGAAGTVVRTSKTAESMRGLVRDNSPRKLQNINYDKLRGMGISDALAEAMLDNFNYDPENETRLIGALASMEGVAGRELFIQRAALQDQPYNARLMREWAELFAAYHANIRPIKAIMVIETAPYLMLEEGVVFGLFPADYVTLDPTFEARNAASIAAIRALGLEPGEAWVTGKVDPRMKPVLFEIGWKQVSGDAEKLLGLTEDS